MVKPDTTKPQATIVSPTNGAVLESEIYPLPVTVSGVATDNKGIKNVQVGLYKASDGTTIVPAANATLGAGTTQRAYSRILNVPAKGDYIIKVYPIDNSNNKNTIAQTLSVQIPPPPDPYHYIDNPTSPISFASNYECIRNGNIASTKGNNSTCVSGRSNKDHIWIQGGTFHTASRPVDIQFCTNVKVTNAECYDSSIEACKVNNCQGVWVEGIYCHDSTENPLDLGVGNDGVVNVGAHIAFSKPNASNSNTGIHYDRAKNVIDKGSNIHDMAYDAVMLQGTIGADVYDFTIARCGKTGINVIKQNATGADSSGIRIHDGTITGTTQQAIYITPTSKDVWVWNITSDKKIQIGSTLVDPKLGTYDNGQIHINKGPPPGYVRPL